MTRMMPVLLSLSLILCCLSSTAPAQQPQINDPVARCEQLSAPLVDYLKRAFDAKHPNSISPQLQALLTRASEAPAFQLTLRCLMRQDVRR